MTFSYVSGNPDNLVGGEDAAMVDIQGPFYDIRDYLNDFITPTPPVMSTLPGGAVDGQEVIYHPTIDIKDGAVPLSDPYWHMRHIDGRWRCIGGAPYTVAVPGPIPIPGLGGGFETLKTRIGIPAPGDWIVSASVRVSVTSPTATSAFTLIAGTSNNAGTAITYADIGSAPVAPLSGGAVSGLSHRRVTTEQNFESWIDAPGYLVVGTVNYGMLQIEPVML